MDLGRLGKETVKVEIGSGNNFPAFLDMLNGDESEN